MRSSSRRICSRSPQFFFRLRRAYQGFFFACGGPRRAKFGATFSDGFSACYVYVYSSSSSSSSQARGKGVAPEAGPWHGAAGLRVKPERAVPVRFSQVLARRQAAAAVASASRTASLPSAVLSMLGHEICFTIVCCWNQLVLPWPADHPQIALCRCCEHNRCVHVAGKYKNLQTRPPHAFAP